MKKTRFVTLALVLSLGVLAFGSCSKTPMGPSGNDPPADPEVAAVGAESFTLSSESVLPLEDETGRAIGGPALVMVHYEVTPEDLYGPKPVRILCYFSTDEKVPTTPPLWRAGSRTLTSRDGLRGSLPCTLGGAIRGAPERTDYVVVALAYYITDDGPSHYLHFKVEAVRWVYFHRY